MNLNTELFYWIFIGCILSVISFELPDRLINQAGRECMAELGYDKKKVSTMYDEKFHMIYPHEVTNKVMECYLGKVNMFKADGEFNREVIIERLATLLPKLLKDEANEEKVASLSKKIYHTCSGQNKVHKMTLMHNCIMDSLEEVPTS